MRVVEIADFGPPDSLVLGERPVPRIATGEVLVKVAAAGVNRADVMQRQGHYPPPPGVTDVPGLEVSGTIAAVARDVEDWTEGQAVCALVTGGGYAEYCRVPAPQCLPVPESIDVIDAAALPEAYFTVWANVFDRGHLKAKQTFLVHGGSSGIGTTAISLACLMGARVFTTAGSDDKCVACRDLGAELAINYRQQDFVSEINKITHDRGVGRDPGHGGWVLPAPQYRLSRRRRADCRDRADGRSRVEGQSCDAHVAAPDPHWIDTQVSCRRTEGGDRCGAARAGLASPGGQAASADRPRHLPLSRRSRGAPGHGGQHSHREAIARPLEGFLVFCAETG